MKNILFICHGNICRSPMAEFVMKDLVKKAGLASQFHIESAATSREEIGNPVYPCTKELLNLSVRATIPTPHSEDKLIGGQMMNYEVNSFQNYESITIDELKDQANSLLNLVTEEQRPLRVCMNNGKEFLLFPQDLLAPICDSDFRLILLSAMRYAMGKNTCMPVVVSDYIKRHISLLDDKFLVLTADDIRRYLEDYLAAYKYGSDLIRKLATMK